MAFKLKLPQLKFPSLKKKPAAAAPAAPAKAAPAPAAPSPGPKFKIPSLGGLKLGRPRLTIGAKLVGLIAALLLTSIAGVGLISTTIMVQNDTGLIQLSNINTAQVLAAQTREMLVSTTDKMRILGATLVQETIAPEVKNRITSEFFSSDKDFLAVYVHSTGENGNPVLVAHASSPELAKYGDTDGSRTLKTVSEDKSYGLGQITRGDAHLTGIKLTDGTTLAIVVGVHFSSSEAIAIPKKTPPAALEYAIAGFVGPLSVRQARAKAAADEASRPKPHNPEGHIITAVVRQSRIADAFTKVDGAGVFMVDRRGKLLAHADSARSAAGESLADLEIVKMMREGKSPNGQRRDYMDKSSLPGHGGASEPQIGAYALVGFAGLGVVAQVPSATAFEGTNQVKYETGLVAGIILCLAFLTGFLYSGTITRPIKRLVDAAGRISQGDFKINLPVKGKDEVAHLSFAFNDMAKGLEERDRVKETFNKFHNKEIAEKLLSGEVKLGGERRLATIFFSDIRGFTAMSEAMQAEQVVEMINEYMTRMVKIIRNHGGVVDKYVGDAIMALWGVPLNGPNDAAEAVKACLEMRLELAHLNAVRIQRGQQPLRIGMGLNTGEVIAGNIGSNEKMEYTVIGDTVNLGSRIEAMTKEFGTDLLISQTVAEHLGGQFLLEPAGSANVKGKSSAVDVFKVTGYRDAQGKSVTVETPYSSYRPEHSDKVQHVAHPIAPPPPEASTVALSMPDDLGDLPSIMETPMGGESSMLIDRSKLTDVSEAPKDFRKSAPKPVAAAPAPAAPAPAAPAPAPQAPQAPQAPAPLVAPQSVASLLAPEQPLTPTAEASAIAAINSQAEGPRVHSPLHAPIAAPGGEAVAPIVRLNGNPEDQATRYSQFMGEKSPEASLAEGPPPANAPIGELKVDAMNEEQTGILQMGTSSMESLVTSVGDSTQGLELPDLNKQPELAVESSTAAMQKIIATEEPQAPAEGIAIPTEDIAAQLVASIVLEPAVAAAEDDKDPKKKAA